MQNQKNHDRKHEGFIAPIIKLEVSLLCFNFRLHIFFFPTEYFYARNIDFRQCLMLTFLTIFPIDQLCLESLFHPNIGKYCSTEHTVKGLPYCRSKVHKEMLSTYSENFPVNHGILIPH